MDSRKETGSEEVRKRGRKEEYSNSKEIIITTQTIIQYLVTFHFHGHLKCQAQGWLWTTAT